MKNRLGYQFPSGLKETTTNKSTMKNLIIGILIFTNIATIITGYGFVWALHTVFDDEQAELINELDKFYFGFCMEAKDSGYGTLESYQHLCGPE